jgi:hypothetical protein
MRRYGTSEKGAYLRPFCCAFADELMQFFVKTCMSAQTDFERGCPSFPAGRRFSIFDPRRHCA